MNAPQDLPLADRIMATIARATSQRPHNADDALATLGADQAAYWAALEQLTAERRIATATIHRPALDAAPWLAIWPTGLCRPVIPTDGRMHSHLFVRNRPNDLRDAFAPRTRDAKSATSMSSSTAQAPRATEQPQQPQPQEPTTMSAQPEKTLAACALRRKAAAEFIAGHPRSKPILIAQLADHLQLSTKGARNIVEELAARGVAEMITINGLTGKGRRTACVYDPRVADPAGQTEPVPAAPAQAAPVPHDAAPAGIVTPPAQPAQPTQPAYRHDDIQVRELVAGDTPIARPADLTMRFALWDDGTLDIYDGDTLMQLPTDAVRRLSLLLGVHTTTGA